MSLRKSPARTPASLAARRRNAQKSPGPRTRRGKAWSCRNHLRHGGESPAYVNFFRALLDAPPCQVGLTAEALLARQEVRHPLFVQMAELAVQGEVLVGSQYEMSGLGGKPQPREEAQIANLPIRSWNVIENIRKSDTLTENKSDLMSANARKFQKNGLL